MSEVAKAIHIIQATTGCRVMLVPMVGEDTPAKPINTGGLKPQESVSVAPRVADAVFKMALQTASEGAEKPVKRTRKTTKPIKEKAATYMTVPKFAQLKGVTTNTVYAAVRNERIAPEMVNKTSGNILIDSRAEIKNRDTNHSRKAIKIFCKETKMTFDSISQAVKATGMDFKTIADSLNKGITTHKGLTFTRV